MDFFKKHEISSHTRPFNERDFNSRVPRYNDDSDYTTNAPSYYDDLARKNQLLKTLSLRIWEYQEVINKQFNEWDDEIRQRFIAWDKNLEEFPDEVKKLLEQWLLDGTLDHIINDTIFSWKADKTYVDENFYITNKKIDDDIQELKDYVDNIKSETNLKINNLFCNPMYFGAVGDGVADDTSAVQDTLNYAMNNKAIVHLTHDHVISDTLKTNSDIKIIGNGLTKIMTSTDFSKHTFIHSSGKLTIEGVNFIETNYNNQILLTVNGGTLFVQNCTFTGEKYQGIVVSDKVKDVKILNNDFKDFYYMVALKGTINSLVHGNTFTGGIDVPGATGGNGVKVMNDDTMSWLDTKSESSIRTIITSNIFESCTGDGVDAFTGGRDLIVSDNLFNNCGQLGIEVKTIYNEGINSATSLFDVRQARNVIIDGNIFKDFESSHATVRISNVEQRPDFEVSLQRGVNNVLITNNIMDNVYIPFAIGGGRHIKINNNICRGIRNRAVLESDILNDIDISNNTFIMATGVTNLTMMSFNHPRTNNVTITNNTLVGNSNINSGILVSSDSFSIKNNKIYNTRNGININDGWRILITGNIFESCDNISILASNGTDVFIHDNSINNCLTGIQYSTNVDKVSESSNIFTRTETPVLNETYPENIVINNRVVF